MSLFVRAARPSRKGVSITAAERDQVLAEKGEVSIGQQLLCRCRYFIKAAVLGSRALVMTRLERFRKLTGRGEAMRPKAGDGAAAGFLALHKIRIGAAPG